MNKNIFTKEKLLPFILTALILIADQVTKALVVKFIPVTHAISDNLINIIHVKNPGIAFSMGDSFPIFIRKLLFILVPIVVIALVVVVYFRNNDFTKLQRWSICGIVGGGLGNIIDRIFRPDGVIDFIDVKFFGIFGLNRWPTFNVADASVVVCGILMIISFCITFSKDSKKNQSEKGEKSEKRADDGIKRTGKVIHIVSKKDIDSSDN